jgi:hypothetical protein
MNDKIYNPRTKRMVLKSGKSGQEAMSLLEEQMRGLNISVKNEVKEEKNEKNVEDVNKVIEKLEEMKMEEVKEVFKGAITYKEFEKLYKENNEIINIINEGIVSIQSRNWDGSLIINNCPKKSH